ncbi:MAG TPA: hypothetical protein VFQ38_06380 [Longimicrobiales bacterium]|nr:hypothetical protein [Longimicrobiales bacterium]
MKKLLLLAIVLAALAAAPPVRARLGAPIAAVVTRVAPLFGDVASPLLRFLARREEAVIRDGLVREREAGRPLPPPARFEAWLRRNVVAARGGRDPWGTPYRLARSPDGLAVESAGADRRFDTPDDVRTTVPQ